MNPPNELPDTAEACAEVNPAPAAETDWKKLTYKLVNEIVFITSHLRAGFGESGMLYDLKSGTAIHWREHVANALEQVPGVKVDREAYHALDLPKAARKKFFAEQAKRKAPPATGTEGGAQ